LEIQAKAKNKKYKKQESDYEDDLVSRTMSPPKEKNKHKGYNNFTKSEIDE